MTTPIEKAMADKSFSIYALTESAGIGRNATRRAIRGEPINMMTAKAIAAALDVHPLDVFEDAGGTRLRRRLTPFEIPPYPTGRGVNPRFWENDYGSHPDAQKAKDAARRLVYG